MECLRHATTGRGDGVWQRQGERKGLTQVSCSVHEVDERNDGCGYLQPQVCTLNVLL